MGLSRSAYYQWKKRPPSKRSVANQELLGHITTIHRENHGCYGRPRLLQALRSRGFIVGGERLRRLMKKYGIVSRQIKKYKTTTNSKHNYHPANNVLNREFQAVSINRAWVADTTYIPTSEGWLYLAVLIDIYSRSVVGWSMSHCNDQQLTLSALEMALAKRKPQAGLIHHSDRGKQYACIAYQNRLRSVGATSSMSRPGNCWDNAVAESFFHSLKVEWVFHCQYKSRQEDRQSIFEYIEIFYNKQRIHSSIEYQSPEAYESKAFFLV